MDRLQSMRVLVQVVEQGSFARAADTLNMSNAVVTRYISDLETHLGTRLLNRTTRKLSLTEAGSLYLDRVRRILEDIDEADAAASYAAKHLSGTLRVYSHVFFGQQQLAHLLPGYNEKYPQVTLDVTLSDAATDLIENRFDVGLFTNLQKFDVSMAARQLATSEVLLCASPAYIKKHGAPATPQDISNHACLNFSLDLLRHHWPFESADGMIHIPVTSKMFSNDGELLRHCAVAGMGLVLRPSYSVGDDLTSGRLVRLLPEYDLGRTSIVMVYPSRRLLPAKVRSFVDYMKARFPDPQADPWCTAPKRKRQPAF